MAPNDLWSAAGQHQEEAGEALGELLERDGWPAVVAWLGALRDRLDDPVLSGLTARSSRRLAGRVETLTGVLVERLERDGAW